MQGHLRDCLGKDMSCEPMADDPRNAHWNSQPRERLFRSPKRISITVPYATYAKLLERSDKEGRSLSNLSSFLLELALSLEHEGEDCRHPVRNLWSHGSSSPIT